MKLPDLPLLTLGFRLQAEDAVVLPPFLGSTLRGAFGSALKRAVCFVPHDDTENCWFREACAYQYIFESKNLGIVPNEDLHAHLRGQKEFPHPFVLIAPRLSRKTGNDSTNAAARRQNFNDDFHPNRFARGEDLNFSILLIGKEAARHWAHVLAAVRLLAENGLGEKRVRFALAEAFAHDAVGEAVKIYSNEDKRVSARGISTAALSQLARAPIDAIERQIISEQQEGFVRIEFVSPGAERSLLSDADSPEIRFYDLIKKISERCEHLASLYSSPSQKIDYRPVLASAETVRTTEKSLKIYRYEQRSNRQQRDVPRDVFWGEISYRGKSVKDFLPFLAAGETLNVGAGSSSGFGRFVVQTQTKS